MVNFFYFFFGQFLINFITCTIVTSLTINLGQFTSNHDWNSKILQNLFFRTLWLTAWLKNFKKLTQDAICHALFNARNKKRKKVNKHLNRPKNRKIFRFNHLVEKNFRKFFADILTFFISWMIQKSLMLYLSYSQVITIYVPKAFTAIKPEPVVKKFFINIFEMRTSDLIRLWSFINSLGFV